MTITANTGAPGSGKTLHAVGETIVAALRERRLVVTNIPLILPALNKYVGHDVSHLVKVLDSDDDCEGAIPFSDVEHFERFEGWRSDDGLSCLFVVDECHEPFASAQGNIKGDHPITHWFARHRHKGCDVVLITQDSIEIPVSMRRRVEFIYRFRKLTALGWIGKNRYVKHTFYGKGADPIDAYVGKYNEAWYSLYHSRGKGIAERLPPQRNVLLTWRTYLILAFIVVSALYLIFSVGGRESVPPAELQRTSPASAESVSTAKPALPFGSAGVDDQAVSPELSALRDELEKLRTQVTLDAYRQAARPVGGRLLPASGENPHAVFIEALPPKRNFLDGASVTIVGHLFSGGQHSYWLMVVQREGQEKVWKSSDLRQFGFTLTGVSSCNAFLKHGGDAYALSCDGPAIVGGRDDDAPVQQRVFEYDSEGNQVGIANE